MKLSLLDPQTSKDRNHQKQRLLYGGGAAIGGVVMITSKGGRLAQRNLNTGWD
jgi:hypothetical protein